ncbi:MAG TPA: DUF2254 domain-containing protein [Gemmatimonadaceae bacterium]|nr:DUF2254 domain-containing protein [Gemmatimonadaceae bacterium]
MKAPLSQVWDRLSSSLWLVPTLLVILHALTAVGMLLVDAMVDASEIEGFAWIVAGGAEAARQVLSTVAASMITVMGVVFSVTIVALQLASSQYTPRVLYAFMRDRGNQLVIGSFIGTFTYALIVLRAVRSPDEGEHSIPTLSATGGIVLALVSVGGLIYFIHHITTSIRVSHIIVRIADSTRPLMRKAFPRSAGRSLPLATVPQPPPDATTIDAEHSGYVQVIDGNGMIEIAAARGFIAWLLAGPGDFVSAGTPLLRAHPPSALDEDAVKTLRGAVATGTERSMLQDPEFGVRQLMDIAVKALSPSINDPTTAITCLDYLGTLLLEVAREPDPSPCRGDETGALRLVGRGATFETLLAHGFDQIRQHTTSNVAVTVRFVSVLDRIGTVVIDDDRRAMLWTQARELALAADTEIRPERDREAIDRVLRELATTLNRDPASILLSTRH